ncbi:putative chaperone protein DNAj [Leptomonas pyrrhocoris]|uniref:Putative chaperone protein DNAj n=1 Tax=Leptomonas pyrrhocoris TaxID=157538 RepID=A0A0M9FYC4_LEPPY|nr:putative chaperone protein DNAj [Leptomonas pyrrhocoris]KPA78640.1 putative chaperone protein DNAj [Leptomonas pyrrhocoris]|eukprot:XP_015657079.1 putative chaperone protein DNAj [Leptomonas pyrrhocoris]
MAVCTWSYTAWTPYEVLRVPSNASVSDIRAAFKKMALRTHPDKQRGCCQGSHEGSRSNNEAASATSSPSSAAVAPVSFHAVKEASEILLDPFLRAAYDAVRSHVLVREVGAISDTLSLVDDFDLVDGSDETCDAAAQVHVYQCECRCGGVYEAVLFADAAPRHGRPLRCECDSCSLVVEVVVE